VFCGLALPVVLIGQSREQQSFHPQIPKAWNDVEVAGYELPLSYGMKTRAVKGHEFGLKLSTGDKQALIAFLRTL
jgi:hypothetical protein